MNVLYPQVYGNPNFMYKQNSRAEYKVYNRAVMVVNRGKNARNNSYVGGPVCYRSRTSEDDVDDVARR
jgi:hypothetical protein